jgi:hypothetical protein
MNDTGMAAMFPKVRRARIGQGEQRGQIVEGVRFDDNTYANVAIKRALGIGKSAEGFEACHIWPLTCYDQRYHTAIANLVLLPRALAGLSDHDIEIQKALQYRAFELYGWWPIEMSQPVKPAFYPSEWRVPQPPILSLKTSRTTSASSLSLGHETSLNKQKELANSIVGWSRKPGSKVHKIIALVVQKRSGISRAELVIQVADITKSKNPYGAVASLLTDCGNSYGHVFEDNDSIIRVRPEFAELVYTLEWKLA